MKKNKEKTTEVESEVKKVKQPAKNENIVSGFKKDELDNELEKLAEIFREELKNNEESQEDYLKDDRGIIYEDEVCQCCGERRKMNNSEYCKQCKEAMREYPFEWPTVIVALLMIVLSVVSVINFSNNFDGYYVARKAKNAAADRTMYTAIDTYYEAIDMFDAEGVNAKFLKFECADAMYDVMAGSDSILELISSALTETEAKLPLYGHYVSMYDEINVIGQTMDKMFDIYEKVEYADAETDDNVYKTAMAEIAGLADQDVIVASVDGKSRTYKGNEAAVYYCLYTYAYLMNKPDDVYNYVNQTYKTGPEYLCMYGYDLGVVYLQTREFATAVVVADALLENNVEDGAAYSIYSASERMKGNYDAAISWADKGLEKSVADTELMRHKAMAYAAKGDYKTAQTVINEAISYNASDLVYPVSMVIENELGNDDRVDEIKDMYEEAELELPKKLEEYLEGKLTAEQLFTEGTGEIQ